MQAIQTQYKGPTNTRSSAIIAKCERGKLRVEWNHHLNPEENHRAACEALCAKFTAEDRAKYGSELGPWGWAKVGGEMSDGHWAWVFVDKSPVADPAKSAGQEEAAAVLMLRRLLDEVMISEECFSRIAPLTLEQARAAIAKATD